MCTLPLASSIGCVPPVIGHQLYKLHYSTTTKICSSVHGTFVAHMQSILDHLFLVAISTVGGPFFYHIQLTSILQVNYTV